MANENKVLTIRLKGGAVNGHKSYQSLNKLSAIRAKYGAKNIVSEEGDGDTLVVKIKASAADTGVKYKPNKPTQYKNTGHEDKNNGYYFKLDNEDGLYMLYDNSGKVGPSMRFGLKGIDRIGKNLITSLHGKPVDILDMDSPGGVNSIAALPDGYSDMTNTALISRANFIRDFKAATGRYPSSKDIISATKNLKAGSDGSAIYSANGRNIRIMRPDVLNNYESTLISTPVRNIRDMYNVSKYISKDEYNRYVNALKDKMSTNNGIGTIAGLASTLIAAPTGYAAPAIGGAVGGFAEGLMNRGDTFNSTGDLYAIGLDAIHTKYGSMLANDDGTYRKDIEKEYNREIKAFKKSFERMRQSALSEANNQWLVDTGVGAATGALLSGLIPGANKLASGVAKRVVSRLASSSAGQATKSALSNASKLVPSGVVKSAVGRVVGNTARGLYDVAIERPITTFTGAGAMVNSAMSFRDKAANITYNGGVADIIPDLVNMGMSGMSMAPGNSINSKYIPMLATMANRNSMGMSARNLFNLGSGVENANDYKDLMRPQFLHAGSSIGIPSMLTSAFSLFENNGNDVAESRFNSGAAPFMYNQSRIAYNNDGSDISENEFYDSMTGLKNPKLIDGNKAYVPNQFGIPTTQYKTNPLYVSDTNTTYLNTPTYKAEYPEYKWMPDFITGKPNNTWMNVSPDNQYAYGHPSIDNTTTIPYRKGLGDSYATGDIAGIMANNLTGFAGAAIGGKLGRNIERAGDFAQIASSLSSGLQTYFDSPEDKRSISGLLASLISENADNIADIFNANVAGSTMANAMISSAIESSSNTSDLMSTANATNILKRNKLTDSSNLERVKKSKDDYLSELKNVDKEILKLSIASGSIKNKARIQTLNLYKKYLESKISKF